MKIKVLTPNAHNKFEFTKPELEALLLEAYNEGYSDGCKIYRSNYIGTNGILSTVTSSSDHGFDIKYSSECIGG